MWGSTWVGATPPCRVAATAAAALVAPTPVLTAITVQDRAGPDRIPRLAAPAA
jgi:hypothetical protein